MIFEDKTSFQVFVIYNNGETLETVSIEKKESLVFPSLVLCLKTPFRDPNEIMLTVQDFERNTWDPMDQVLSFKWHPKDGEV